jgi:hypothetical protein
MQPIALRAMRQACATDGMAINPKIVEAASGVATLSPPSMRRNACCFLRTRRDEKPAALLRFSVGRDRPSAKHSARLRRVNNQLRISYLPQVSDALDLFGYTRGTCSQCKNNLQRGEPS